MQGPTDVSARTWFLAGPVRGRTHRSAPTRGGVVFRIQRGLAQDGTSSKGAEQSPPLAAGCAWGTAGCGHPALRKQHRWCPAKGRCRHRPLQGGEQAASTTRASGAQRSVCASGREGWAGIGAKTIPNGGPPRNLPGSALSAERAAGQIRSLPDDIRVQHGVQRLEVSVKPRPCLR